MLMGFVGKASAAQPEDPHKPIRRNDNKTENNLFLLIFPASFVDAVFANE
jgi:hypothetical protein